MFTFDVWIEIDGFAVKYNKFIKFTVTPVRMPISNPKIIEDNRVVAIIRKSVSVKKEITN